MDKDSLDRVRGPESMRAPQSANQANNSYSRQDAHPSMPGPSNPAESGAPKKRRHRGGRKKKNRRQSFIAPSESTQAEDNERPSLLATGSRPSAAQASFYRLREGDRSNTSLESEALLDHRYDAQPWASGRLPPRHIPGTNNAPSDREQGPLRTRRQSIQRGSMPFSQRTPHRQSFLPSSPTKTRTPRTLRDLQDDDDEEAHDRTPLLGSSYRDKPAFSRGNSHISGYGSGTRTAGRRKSLASSHSSKRGKKSDDEDYDVNNPPSVPGSPKLGSLDDVMIAEEFSHSPRETVIDIDKDASHESSPAKTPDGDRRRTIQYMAENDVCYPGDIASEIGDEEVLEESGGRRPRRRRGRQWPDLEVLDEWSREEKEERNIEQIRAKKISEPVMVGGRLRPTKTVWHREEDDAPYRYTYFNENLDGTIHSRTISELCQFGATFEDLFRPQPAELSDSSDDDDEENGEPLVQQPFADPPNRGRASREGSMISQLKSPDKSGQNSGSRTPAQSQSHTPRPKQKRYGPRPTFWLDVLCPTEQEMKVLAKSFGIHQLTTEDILMQEPREKVELFQSYYFVNYRSFEQDKDNEDYMEPVNMYVVVFRDGVISVS